jgi:nucleotide-binding universal stress UspA family protein
MDLLSKIIDEIKEPLEKQNVRARPVWSTGRSIADDILEFAQKSTPELIVLTSALDVIAKPDFVGPHTQKIIHGSKVALLSIKKVGAAAIL